MKKLLVSLVLVWTVREFWTLKGVTDFLNGLPEQRAVEAKINCYNMNSICQVFYREDK